MASIRPQQLFRHGGLYVISTLTTALLSFAVLPVYVKVLGKEGLGQVEVLQVATTALMIVLSQGLPSAWFRMRFEHQGHERRAFESIVLVYIALTAALALGLGMIVGPWLARAFTPEIPFYPLWLLSIAIAAFNVFGDVYAAGLQADSRSIAYGVFMIARRVLSIGLVVWLLVVARWGVLGKVAGEALAVLGVAVCVLVLVRPTLPARSSRPLLTAAVAYGLPILPHSLAMQIVAVSDRFVLHHYLGLSAVGVYALGYRIASVLETVNGGLGNAYRTLFISSAAELDRADRDEAGLAERKQQAGFKLADIELKLLAAASFSGLALSGATRELLALTRIDLQAFAPAWGVCYIVCWGLFAHAAYAVLATPLLYAQRGTARLFWISGAAAVINVLACVAFIPRGGLLAAAWATAAAHACLAIGAWLTGRRIWPLPRPWVRWGALFACHSLVIACSFQLDMQVTAWPTRVAAKAVLLVAGAFICARCANVSPSVLLQALKAMPR
jgi:O-antigen/teichoic acid export membrane protein